MSRRRATVWQRFARKRASVGGLAVLLLMLAACFVTLPWSAPRAARQDLARVSQSPGRGAALGTDELGRSMLARVLYGGAISLSLGLLAAAIAVVVGATYGAVAGFFGGAADALLMRCVDLLYALPSTLLIMLLTLVIEQNLLATGARGGMLAPEWVRLGVLALSIGAVSWLTTARVVRGQVLLIREQPYIEAARALGLPTWRILLRHVAPNLVAPIVVFAALAVPAAILQESFLSFLGIGVRPPQASWGSLVADGVRTLNPVQSDWWLLLTPCVLLSVTLLALNFVGDGVRDAFDMR